MTSLIKTTSNIHLIDATNGQEIHWNRPTVVKSSSFIQTRLEKGDIALIKADLPDTATDEDFLKFWKDSEGKEDLAVSSFLSQYEPKKEEKKEEPKAKAK